MLKISKKDSRTQDREQTLSIKPAENFQWREIKTPSTVVSRRSCHSSCIYQQKLYIYGGYDNNSPGIFKDLICYSFQDNKWEYKEQKGSIPGPRHSHSVVVYKDKMYLFGGMYNYMSNTNQLHIFDFKSDSWTQAQTNNPPPNVDSHNCCLYGNQMIVALGYSDQEYQATIYSLDLDSLTWKVLFDPTKSKISHPQPRSQGTCCVHGDKLIIYGGKDSYTTFDDLWHFDFKSLTFQKIQLNTEIAGRFGHCAIVDDGKMYIFGGTRGVTHERNDLVVIDLVTTSARTCWVDSQEERTKIREDSICSLIKKSRRDSAKKGLNWLLGEDKEDADSLGNKSPGKYRTQLKEVGYYNSLYDRQQNDAFGIKKTRKNPLLKELNSSQSQSSDHMNMTATFEILTNSILLTQGKNSCKDDKNEFTHQYWRKTPKARDNSSVNLLRRGQNLQMVIFGGGMHKIGFNDILLIDLAAVNKNYLSDEI